MKEKNTTNIKIHLKSVSFMRNIYGALSEAFHSFKNSTASACNSSFTIEHKDTQNAHSTDTYNITNHALISAFLCSVGKQTHHSDEDTNQDSNHGMHSACL